MTCSVSLARSVQRANVLRIPVDSGGLWLQESSASHFALRGPTRLADGFRPWPRSSCTQVVRAEAQLLSPSFVNGLLDPPLKRVLGPFNAALQQPQEIVNLPVGVQ